MNILSGRTVTAVAVAAAGLALAGCGGGGGGGGSAGLTPTASSTPPPTVAAPLQFSGVVNTRAFFSRTATGPETLTVTVSDPDGQSLGPINQMILDGDETVTIQIAGQPTRTVTPANLDRADPGLLASWTTGSEYFRIYRLENTRYVAAVQYGFPTTSTFSEGPVGIPTAAADVPRTGTVTYRGPAYSVGFSSFVATVNFGAASNQVSGTLSGAQNSATFNAQISGNTFGGPATAILADGVNRGQGLVAGAFYGPGAVEIGAAFMFPGTTLGGSFVGSR